MNERPDAPLTLAAIVNRPTQFDPPLWAALARRGRIRPIVYYLSTGGFVDPETGNPVNWGDGVASAYATHTLAADAVAGRIAALTPRPAAVLAEGWANRTTWRVAATCWLRGIPVILPSDRVGDPREPGWRRLARRSLRTVMQPVFAGHITPGSLGEAALQADGVPADRIARSLYPIDTALFQRRMAEQADMSRQLRARWPEGSRVIIAVAKLAPRESPLLIVDTYAKAREIDPRVKLLLVGDGPMRGAVEAHVGALGLGGDVHLPGYVRYPLLPGHYGAADVFLHVAEFEPWGISVSEAMACGLPVVTTANVGASRDLVVSGQTGATAERADPAVLATRVLEALDLAGRPETRAALAARTSLVDVEQAAARLEALVERIRRR